MTSDHFNDSCPLCRLSLQSLGDRVLFFQLALRQIKKFALKRNGLKKAERWKSIWVKALILSNRYYVYYTGPISLPFVLCTCACMPFLERKSTKIMAEPSLLAFIYLNVFYRHFIQEWQPDMLYMVLFLEISHALRSVFLRTVN